MEEKRGKPMNNTDLIKELFEEIKEYIKEIEQLKQKVKELENK